MTAQEKTQTTALIRDVFGNRLGRTLDVGCGTGWPLDEGLVDPVRYVGIDPSTGMLNALVAKHPHLAGVHPMTFAQAVEQKVLCGTRFDTVWPSVAQPPTSAPKTLPPCAGRRRDRCSSCTTAPTAAQRLLILTPTSPPPPSRLSAASPGRRRQSGSSPLRSLPDHPTWTCALSESH
jgi:hypothetical protein